MKSQSEPASMCKGQCHFYWLVGCRRSQLHCEMLPPGFLTLSQCYHRWLQDPNDVLNQDQRYRRVSLMIFLFLPENHTVWSRPDPTQTLSRQLEHP